MAGSSKLSSLILVLLLTLLPAVRLSSGGQSADFSENVLVEQLDIPSASPEIAIAPNGSTYVIWDTGDGEDDIYFAKSVDGGKSFCCQRRVNDDTVNASQNYASIAVGPDGSIHVAWSDYRNDLDRKWTIDGGIDGINDADIYYSRSDDGGTTFLPNVKVNDDIGTRQTTHMHRFIAVDVHGKVHLAWTDHRSGGSEVFYANSSDGGVTFSKNAMVSGGNGNASSTSLTTDADGVVYVVWEDSTNLSAGVRAFLSMSIDGGESFGSGIMIDDSPGDLRQHNVEVASASGIVGVVWEEDGSSQVYFASSMDGGDSFTEPKTISDSGLSPPEREPTISINQSGYVAIAWKDRRNSDYDILFTDSHDLGGSFEPNVRVNDDATSFNQYQPSIATDNNGHVYIVWMDFRSGVNWDIYFAKSPSTTADLVTTPADILFSDGDIVPYETQMTINTTIWNFGDANASDVHVDFFDGQPGEGELIGTDSVPFIMMNGGQGSVEVSWLAVEPQFHEICVFADSDNSITESNETNNTACRIIEVIVPPIPAPPGNLTARLSGDVFSNVTLVWSLSPDDGGPINVSRYDVFRSESFDPSRVGYVPIGTVPNGTGEYVDENAGEGDPDNHFYYVCAIGDMNISSCTEDQVGKFTRVLDPGPNLVSLPLVQLNESIDAILQTVSYNAAWSFNTLAAEWTWYMTFKKYRRGLWTANHTVGLWVNATVDCNLTVAGVVPAQTTIHLYEGWNLSSFPSFKSSYTVFDLKTDTGAVRLEGYDSASPHHLRVLGDADVLLAGEAYWVKIGASTDWFVNID